MASFTSVGDLIALRVPASGEVVDVAISGTYNMEIKLQREIGSPASGAWETLETWSTANATVAATYTTRVPNESLRLIVTVDTSGTATATLGSTFDKTLARFITDEGELLATYKQSGLTLPGLISFAGRTGPAPVNVSAATLTVTPAEHAGRTVTLSRAAGTAVAMPAATGTGNQYRFVVVTAVSGGSHVITATGLIGNAITLQDAGNTMVGFEVVAGNNTITLNGTTTGGKLGDEIILEDVASGQWAVRALVAGTGTEATPFSTV